MKLRPEVLRFAFRMEEVLQRHDARKGAAGWHDCNPSELCDGLDSEILELKEHLDSQNQTVRPDTSLRAFAEECADVANYAMMLCDNVNQLPVCRHGLIEAMNAHCT